VVLTDRVIDVIRRELRRGSPDVRVETEQIRDVPVNEVINRGVLEGDRATEANDPEPGATATEPAVDDGGVG
jgi:dihydropteroate synthase